MFFNTSSFAYYQNYSLVAKIFYKSLVVRKPIQWQEFRKQAPK